MDIIEDSLVGFTPVSEAMVIIPFSSIWYLAGRRPFLSKTQIAHLPSVITIPAGPSHASICIELYSWKDLISASRICPFCHAGGRTILIARNIFIPPFSNNSIILSSDDESDPVSLIKYLNFDNFGIKGVINFDLRAFAQFLLPLIALISPLWANNLKGCAKCHLGLVLVENLWWKAQIEAVKLFFRRSL